MRCTRTACLLILVALSFVAGGRSAASATDALPVVVAPVTEAEFVDSIEALGTLRAVETARLTSPITETIAEVRFDDGQRVQAGEVLVVLTQREQKAQLDEAEAEVREARRQYDRVSALVGQGLESRAELDQRRRDIDTAQARLDAVKARLADRLIVAPFSGVLGLRNISVGSLLVAGEQVAVLHDDAWMNLDFSVPETFLGRIATGTAVTAESRAFPGQSFAGEVVALDNRVDPITRSIEVRARIANAGALLRPGMLMSVDVAVDRRRARVIPEEAVLPLGRENFVFVAEEAGNDGHVARRVAVRLGARRPGEVEVLEGLEPGRLVISHGGIQVSEGQRVAVRRALVAGPGGGNVPRGDREE